MKRTGLSILSLPVLALAAGSALAGSQSISECGYEITEPGHYKLVQDLENCPSNGIWISSSDVNLDLKGHTISCADNFDCDVPNPDYGTIPGVPEFLCPEPIGGVLILNPFEKLQNVTVRNGTVTNCNDGVGVIYAEHSKVTGITSTGNGTLGGPWSFGTGITLWLSNDITVLHNELYGNEAHGIGIWESSDNVIKHNTVAESGIDAVWSEMGTDSVFMCNEIYANPDGMVFESTSTGNLVKGNYVTGNYLGGIWMYGLAFEGWVYTEIPTDNVVMLNVFENNGWGDIFEVYWDVVTGDLITPEPDGICANTWKKNRYGFAMAEQGCLPESFDLEAVCALEDDDSSSDDDSDSDDDSSSGKGRK